MRLEEAKTFILDAAMASEYSKRERAENRRKRIEAIPLLTLKTIDKEIRKATKLMGDGVTLKVPSRYFAGIRYLLEDKGYKIISFDPVDKVAGLAEITIRF